MSTSRKKSIYLAKMNGFERDLYVQDVRRMVGDKLIPPDEIAILRKMVNRQNDIIVALLDVVVRLHGSEIIDLTGDAVIEEFKAYNAEVEAIKALLKEEIGI